MSDHQFVLDELDTLATEAYPGLVVRKDLLRRMRSAFGATCVRHRVPAGQVLRLHRRGDDP